MGEEYSSDVPLLSSGEITLNFEPKKTPIIKVAAKWVLKVLMWVIFVAWISLMFTYPSETISHLVTHNWINATKGTVFGLTGSLFFAFTAPVLILAFLAMLYLVISDEEEIQEKKTSKRPTFSLWTFPVIVNGPFGVVTAAEFIGILLVFAFVMWACITYTVHNWIAISESQMSAFFKRCLMLEKAGANLGLIGLFCLSLLFIPISRGSILLRLIDIPFEHATRYHVWLGHLTMVLFTLHGLIYVLAWAMEGRLIEQMATVRELTANFHKLDKFEGIGFRRWQKKMHFLLTSLSVAYVLTTPKPVEEEDETLETTRRRTKWEIDDYICRGHILNDVRNTLKHKKEDMNIEQLGSHLRIEEGIRVQDGQKDANPSSSTINMVEDVKSKDMSNPRKRGRDTVENKGKRPKVDGEAPKRACWICGKPGHFKNDCTIWKRRMSKKKAQKGKGETSQSQGKQE